MRLLYFVVLCLAVLGLASPGDAAEKADGGWNYVLAPYFLAPNMSGDVSVHGVIVNVDASPSDVFDRLQAGGMLYYEMYDAHWAVSIDALYMDLEQDGSSPLGTYSTGVKQTGVITSVYRRLSPWIDVGAGLQLNIFNVDLTRSGTIVDVEKSGALSWADPFVATRLTVPGTSRWRLAVVGTVGGFGVGSDLAWQVHPMVGFRASKTLELNVAYRAMNMDYSAGSEARDFKYDVTTFGPEAGLSFHF
jgi:hypothetical protein